MAEAQAAAEAAKKAAEEEAAKKAEEGVKEESCDASSGGEEAEAAPVAAPVVPEINLDDLMEGWSDARKKAWNNREKTRTSITTASTPPASRRRRVSGSPRHAMFLKTLESVRSGEAGYPMYQWGSFSKNIPGRVGYQCSNYYRTLIKSGEVVDENYMMDEG